MNVGGVGFSAGAGFGSGLAQVLMPPKWITTYETLKTREETWEDLDEEDSYVKTGDSVVQVVNDVDARDESKPEHAEEVAVAPEPRG